MKHYVSTLLSVLCLLSITLSVGEENLNIFEGENGLFGVEDREGTMIVEPKYEEICGFFNSDTGIYSHVIGRYGFGLIESNGNEIAPCEYDSILGPSEGYYVVTVCDLANDESFCQFYSVDGSPTTWIFDWAWDFSDGYATVGYSDGSEYLLDTSGQLHSIRPYHLASGDGFHEERLLVSLDGLYGYMDLSLQLAVPCIYTDADCWFQGGEAKVKTKDGLWIRIDKEGNIVDD